MSEKVGGHCCSFFFGISSLHFFIMDQTNMPILTPYNYFEWKSRMTIHLRKAGLNRITMGLETEPDKDEDKSTWFNKCDETYETLCLSVSPDFLFHIDSLDTPNEI